MMINYQHLHRFEFPRSALDRVKRSYTAFSWQGGRI